MDIEEFSNYFILSKNENHAEALEYCNQRTNENLKNDEYYLESPVAIWKAEGYEVIIPEGIEEVIIYDGDNIKIERLYLSSKVRLFGIKSILEKKAGNIYVEVSPENKYFSSFNGSIYSKDYSDLYYLCKSVSEIKIHAKCEKFKNGCRAEIDGSFNLPDQLKSLGTESLLIKEDEEIILPDALIALYTACFVSAHFLKIHIPKTTRIIEKNEVHFCVSEENPYFSSEDGNLYTKSFEKFLQGYHIDSLQINESCKEIDLNALKCSEMKIPANVEKITGYNICKNRYIVHKDNKWFSDYKGSLYTKDFSVLVDYYEYSQNVIEIHPGCKEIRKGAIKAKIGQRSENLVLKVPECLQNDFELQNYIS